MDRRSARRRGARSGSIRRPSTPARSPITCACTSWSPTTRVRCTRSATTSVSSANRSPVSARESIAAAAPIDERRGIVDWDLGDLPRVVESGDRSLDVQAYPALLDVGDSVALRVVTSPELQARVMRGGVRRLLILNAAPTRSSIVRKVSNDDRLAIAAGDIELGELSGDCVAAAVDKVMTDHGALPWTEAEFDDAAPGSPRRRAGTCCERTAQGGTRGGCGDRGVRPIGDAASRFAASVGRRRQPAPRPSRPSGLRAGRRCRSSRRHRALRPCDQLSARPSGGRARSPISGAWPRSSRSNSASRRSSTLPARRKLSPVLVELRWQLEDLRVADFAQPLMIKRPGQRPVSAKRVAAALAALR